MPSRTKGLSTRTSAQKHLERPARFGIITFNHIHRPRVSWLPNSRLAHTGDIVMQQWPMCTKHGNSKYYKVL